MEHAAPARRTRAAMRAARMRVLIYWLESGVDATPLNPRRTGTVPARLNLLRSGIGECGLGRQQVDDAADSFAIAAGGDLHRLLCAGEKIICRSDTLFGGLQRVIRDENLSDDVLPRLIG